MECLVVLYIWVVYGEDKRRKFFLFDLKEVVVLDKEVIYVIGGCVFDINIFLFKCWFYLFNYKKLDNYIFYYKFEL